MEFKGTPGPWFVDYSGANDAYEIAPMDPNGITMNWDKEICITADNSIENANLIAAAPDLLEALQGLLIRIADEEEYGPEHAVTKARAAISKALGEE